MAGERQQAGQHPHSRRGWLKFAEVSQLSLGHGERENWDFSLRFWLLVQCSINFVTGWILRTDFLFFRNLHPEKLRLASVRKISTVVFLKVKHEAVVFFQKTLVIYLPFGYYIFVLSIYSCHKRQFTWLFNNMPPINHQLNVNYWTSWQSTEN